MRKKRWYNFDNLTIRGDKMVNEIPENVKKSIIDRIQEIWVRNAMPPDPLQSDDIATSLFQLVVDLEQALGFKIEVPPPKGQRLDKS